MNKKIFLLSLFFPFLAVQAANAVCPICTVAVVGGFSLAKKLGVDDIISGLWAGGLTISLGLWFATWLKKRWPKLWLMKWQPIIWSLLSFGSTAYFLWQNGTIGRNYCPIINADKGMFGMIVGAAGFAGGALLDRGLRWYKNYKYYKIYKNYTPSPVFFPYQKVILPILTLTILSVIFYFLTVKGGLLYHDENIYSCPLQ